MCIPRFVIEYANFQIKGINESELINDVFKQQALDKINDTVNSCEKGLITVDEAMANLARVFD